MSDSSKPLTVVLADDHPLVLRGLCEFLATAEDVDVVATACNGQEAVSCVAKFTPDVLVLDLLLPDQAPEDIIRAAKAGSPRTQIVILTSHEGGEHVLSATRAGAVSYLLKDIAPDELIKAVQRAARGEGTITPRLAKLLLAVPAKDDAPLASLTSREREVLGLIAEAQSNTIIAKTLDISVKTVKSHVSNILGKLQLSDRTAAAVYAWREKIRR